MDAAAEPLHWHLNLNIERAQQDVANWEKFKEEYRQLDALLHDLPKKVSHDVMIPLGRVAFVPGQIVHTNELLVLLGENLFAEKTASQAIDVVSRRMELVEKNLKKANSELAQIQSRLQISENIFNGGMKKYNEEGLEIVDIREDYVEEEHAPKKEKSGSSVDQAVSKKGDQLKSGGKAKEIDEENERIFAKLRALVLAEEKEEGESQSAADQADERHVESPAVDSREKSDIDRADNEEKEDEEDAEEYIDEDNHDDNDGNEEEDNEDNDDDDDDDDDEIDGDELAAAFAEAELRFRKSRELAEATKQESSAATGENVHEAPPVIPKTPGDVFELMRRYAAARAEETSDNATSATPFQTAAPSPPSQSSKSSPATPDDLSGSGRRKSVRFSEEVQERTISPIPSTSSSFPASTVTAIGEVVERSAASTSGQQTQKPDPETAPVKVSRFKAARAGNL